MHVVVWIANVLVLFAIAFQVARKEPELRSVFWLGCLLKCICGVLVGLLYIDYYESGDTIHYYLDASKIADLARADPSAYMQFLWTNDAGAGAVLELNLAAPRAIFLSKMASIAALLTSNDYWLMAVWFSFVSFLLTWLLLRELVRHDSRLQYAAVLSLLFFPSAVFWSSGLIKESMAMAMLSFVACCFVRVWDRRRFPIQWLLFLPFALWILWSLKYYYVAVLCPILLTELVYSYIMSPRLGDFSRVTRALVWVMLFVIPLISITILHPNLNPQVFLDVIVDNHDAYMLVSDESSRIDYGELEPTFMSMLANAPTALVSGLYRPFFWESDGLVQLLAGVENLLLMVLTACAMIRFLKHKSVSRGGAIILLYTVSLCVFLALSAPNLGTLSRYRVGFLPFFVLLLFNECPIIRTLPNWVGARFKNFVR